MTDRKISELTAITGGNVSDANDVLVIVDTDANTTKKITREELFKGVSGNVGIGTSSPDVFSRSDSVTLGIQGSTTASLGINAASGSVASIYLGQNGVRSGQLIGGSGYTTLNAGSGNYLTLGTNFIERMRIDSSGNLGLGTTTPTGKFTVTSGSSDHIRLEGTSGDPYGLWTSATGTSLTVGSWGNGARINLFDSSELITFGVGAASEERMRINNSGNVGIGTTNPSDLLHVKGSAATIGDYQIVAEGFTGGYGAGISFQSQLTGGSLAEMARITADGEASWNTTAANQDAGLRFYTSLNGTVAERLRIDSSGNVGIGTTAPSTSLSLSGATSTSFGVSLTPSGWNGAKHRLTVPADGGESVWSWNYNGSTVDSSLYSTGKITVGRYGLQFATGGINTAPSERMRIDSSGNLLVGGTSSAASAAAGLHLFNGTAPTGNVTDGVVLYSEDVSASAELKVRDEAGNVTTLSPHNFSLIPEGPSEEMAFGYYSEKRYTEEEKAEGKTDKAINIDLLKLARLLEDLTGEKLVHIQEK